MDFQASLGRKSGATNVAAEFFHVGPMGFHVTVKSGFDSKGSTADIASEWFFPSVDSDMPHKIAGFFEGLGTVRTLVGVLSP